MNGNGALTISAAPVGRFGHVTEKLVRHPVRAPFFLDELPEAVALMRVVSATERGRCACSLGVPVGTDTAAQ